MRYAIISDIHANLEAMESVLKHIKKRGISDILCLGDVVGYGPNPIECCQLVMEHCLTTIKGNHDEAIIQGAALFSPRARVALEWTKQVLQGEYPQKAEIWEFLAELPLTLVIDEVLFVHGSPLDPTSDYVLARMLEAEPSKFQRIFEAFDTMLFVGHTHMPCVITEARNHLSLPEINYKYEYAGQKLIVNVGSVGQPRDRDPSSCYVEVIDSMIFFHRVPYDYRKTQEKILATKQLDETLAARLANGV